ncbi:MAG: 6-carboxytetrahydropterin synthase QueD [Elusimicrobiota bacterium]|nr:6-carboxytetrahydropterin synthase QueD [Elusimicrobiota bacterium]
MYEVMVEGSFSAAHNLRGYRKKCEKLHGHNWKVRVGIRGGKLDKYGMLIDFRDVKDYLEKIIKKLDHKYLNEISHFKVTNPTSENIARFIYNDLKFRLQGSQYGVSKVTVWESDTTSATYLQDRKDVE